MRLPARKSSIQDWNSASSFIGESAVFRAARERIGQIAQTQATVVIEGETGTGKELAARIIHYEGARSAGPFIPLNCGALPDSLLESELFGHRRGAFTDARESSPGLLLLADGGTLFLDEIDSLSLRAQVVLLRFLQQRTIRPLGGGAERKVDARIVCASNRSLEQLVTQQLFRQDLFYRLNVMHVELPPLRERSGDVEVFANYFLRALSERHELPQPQLDAESLAWLCAQQWPGNVRQLENLLEREFLLARSAGVLRLSSLGVRPQQRDVLADGWNYGQAKARLLEKFDREFLVKLMHHTQGNVAQAARVAGKERRDLGRMLQKYCISPRQFRCEVH
jgi:DNA-binding NtrC family response regulator